jgi:lysophospholipase L1-like esterase
VSAVERDLRVLFFGDSIVAGVGDPQARGWVGRVAAATRAAGMAVTAYPLGIRRQTSVEIAARWRAEALPRLQSGADCRVVFAFGVNDATMQEGAPRVDPGVSAATLTRVLDEASELGLPAFVVGPSPVAEPEHTARVRELSQRFAAICAPRAIPFVTVVEPLVASAVWLDEAAAGDGAHPGAGGYEALARLVLAGGWLDWIGAPDRLG